jgi:DNA-binding PucR family transcriptional regulator
LAKLPGKNVWNRRLRKREWITTIPIILRNLAPSSGFDPQEVWEKEQKLEAQERDQQEEEEENANSSGKKGKKEKKKVVKKKDAIIANNKIAKVDKLFERDMEIISNKKRDGKSK